MKKDFFVTKYDPENFELQNAESKSERKISEMKDEYLYGGKIGENEQDIVYEVSCTDVKKQPGSLLQAITVIHPGDVGGEFFMTKGHYHKDETCDEIYICMSGKGVLILQDENEAHVVELTPGVSAYILGKYGHRTINVSDEDFVFMSIWPGNSVYDYERTKKEPFQKRIFKKGAGYEVR